MDSKTLQKIICKEIYKSCEDSELKESGLNAHFLIYDQVAPTLLQESKLKWKKKLKL